jgi:hypothetical protein
MVFILEFATILDASALLNKVIVVVAVAPVPYGAAATTTRY